MGEPGQLANRIGAVSHVDAERTELATVLASPTFSRSLRLVKLLEFISEKHFSGRDSEVCEYSIATEVLGRPPDFDPAEDAIARVEIHRLRKKLREYYSGEGSHQALKILIPPGMYTPVFQQNGNSVAHPRMNGKTVAEPVAEPVSARALEEPVEVSLSETSPAEAPQSAVPPSQRQPKTRKIWLWAAGAVILVAAATAIVARLRTTATHDPEPVVLRTLPPAAAAPADNAVRFIAGYDRTYIDHHGHTWLPDRYFEGGGRPAAPFRQYIARTSDPLLYQNGRIGLTAYNIPLKSGVYELKLHFIEPVYGPGLETGGGENSRVFDILINDKLMIDGFDIVSDAGGPLIADIRVFKDVQPGPDGILKVGFHAKREQTIVSAIEIEPAEPHRTNPIRIVTEPNSVTDSRGQVWEADNYYFGGQTSNHWKSVTGTPDADLFSNERYGHFSYAFPWRRGASRWGCILREPYGGKENQGGGGPGQRLFDIYCNGSALARNLDILKEAGPNHALIKHFRGLRPNAQGKLNLDFVPVANYASVFAIEVLDE